MSTRRITISAAAAALALLASACSDRLTAPAAHPAERALTTSASDATLIPNSVRYADTGGRPATGRSGSAALDALALLGKDGYTDVELRPYAADPARDAQGTVTRAQVKAFAESGRLLFTRSAEGGQALRFPGLLRGGRVEVQANVGGIDPHRTDVVAVTQTVMLRPDLEVTLAAPETVNPGLPANITAVVSEKNGDVGATATCALRVDDVVVDEAQGIWVDAGDAVSCAFTYQFSQPGTYTAEVTAGATAPADWDESNNAASAPVTVTAPGVAIPHTAFVEEIEGYNYAESATRFSDAGGPIYEQVAFDTTYQHTQTIQLLGSVPYSIPGPVTVDVSQTTGGRTLHSARFTGGSAFAMWCASTGQGPTFFFACSQSFGPFKNTMFLYQRYGGTVTYHSTTYTRTWWDGAMEENVYHRNHHQEDFFGFALLGDSFQFAVRMTAADGTEYRADADFPLVARIRDESIPESCTTEQDDLFSYEYCNSSSFRQNIIFGGYR